MTRLCKYALCRRELPEQRKHTIYSLFARKARHNVMFCSNVCYVMHYQRPKGIVVKSKAKSMALNLPAFDIEHFKEELAFRTAVNELFQLRKEKRLAGEHLDEERALKEMSIPARVILFRQLFD